MKPNVRTPLACTISAALSLGLFSLDASAMRLGELQVHSRLGEAFSARVPVTLNEGESIVSACVRLVGRDPVNDDGLAMLTTAKVAVEKGNASTSYITIQTAQTVSEPAVRLFLEVGCDATIAKRFVALLDPPFQRDAATHFAQSEDATTPVAEKALIPDLPVGTPADARVTIAPPKVSKPKTATKTPPARRQVAQAPLAVKTPANAKSSPPVNNKPVTKSVDPAVEAELKRLKERESALLARQSDLKAELARLEKEERAFDAKLEARTKPTKPVAAQQIRADGLPPGVPPDVQENLPVSKVEQNAAAIATDAKKVALPSAPPNAPLAIQPEQPAETSIIDDVLADPEAYAPLVGAGLALVVGVGALVARRRRAAKMEAPPEEAPAAPAAVMLRRRKKSQFERPNHHDEVSGFSASRLIEGDASGSNIEVEELSDDMMAAFSAPVSRSPVDSLAESSKEADVLGVFAPAKAPEPVAAPPVSAKVPESPLEFEFELTDFGQEASGPGPASATIQPSARHQKQRASWIKASEAIERAATVAMEGDFDGAIARLQQALREDANAPAGVWVMLMRLMRTAELKPMFDALSQRFTKQFKRNVPAWDAPVWMSQDDGLDARAGLRDRLSQHWGTPQALEALGNTMEDIKKNDEDFFSAALHADLLKLVHLCPEGVEESVFAAA